MLTEKIKIGCYTETKEHIKKKPRFVDYEWEGKPQECTSHGIGFAISKDVKYEMLDAKLKVPKDISISWCKIRMNLGKTECIIVGNIYVPNKRTQKTTQKRRKKGHK